MILCNDVNHPKFTFNDINYKVIKNVIDKKIANFLYKYLLFKKDISTIYWETDYIPIERRSKDFCDFGHFKDVQLPGTFSIYADTAMELLLGELCSNVEKETNMNLYPTYSYARTYRKNDILERHKDRYSCEISCTLNLGGDKWPIFIEAEKNVGLVEDGFVGSTENKGTKVLLEPGDMMIYKGMACEHWREPFEGENCVQVFLHYNQKETPGSEENKYDGRSQLGLSYAFSKWANDEKNRARN